MSTQEPILLLLPAAVDVGNGQIQYRRYPLTVMVRRENMFVASRLEEITVQPPWARINLMRMVSGAVVGNYTSENGRLIVAQDITDAEQENFILTNQSIDTEAMLTLKFRSWQYGETGL